jgi:hypothetical protein
MGMIAEEGPGVTRGLRVGEQRAHALYKARPVAVIPEDQSALDASDDDVVEDSRRIETGMTGHGLRYRGESHPSRVIYLLIPEK